MIQPRHEHVLLQRIPPKPGHIILTDVQTVRWARVVAVGPDIHEDDLKVGDVVVLPGIAAEIPDVETDAQILVQIGDIGAKVS